MRVSKRPIYVAGALVLADMVLYSNWTMRNRHQIVQYCSDIGFRVDYSMSYRPDTEEHFTPF